jgi:hypothetical protein
VFYDHSFFTRFFCWVRGTLPILVKNKILFFSEQPENLIRMLSMGEHDISDSDLYCEFDGRVVKAYLKQLESASTCKWSSYFIDCPTFERPKKMAIVDGGESKHEVGTI